MLLQLTKRCYDDYCFYNQIELEERKQFVEGKSRELNDNEFVIPYLPIYLTTACTLNCKKCNNLMPMFKGKENHFDADKICNSLNIILSEVREMIFCELLGGEPFLYPDFEKVLDYVGNQNKIRQIVVVTNGTIVPSQAIISKLSKYKTIVRVSDYGLFDSLAKFVSVMDKNNVNVRIQTDMRWNDPGNLNFRGKSADEVKTQYNRCEFSLKCKYLCEDKLFTCARIASLYLLGITKASGDVLFIDNETKREDLQRFYLHETGQGCQYCDLWSNSGGELIPAAEQVDKQLNHSRYTVISNYELNHYKNNSREYEKLLKTK